MASAEGLQLDNHGLPHFMRCISSPARGMPIKGGTYAPVVSVHGHAPKRMPSLWIAGVLPGRFANAMTGIGNSLVPVTRIPCRGLRPTARMLVSASWTDRLDGLIGHS